MPVSARVTPVRRIMRNDVDWLGAHGDADADFVAALLDAVRDQAEEPDRGEEQSGGGECGHENAREAALRDRLRDVLAQVARFVDWQFAIERADLLADGREQAQRFALGAHDDIHRAERGLLVGHVSFGIGGLPQIPMVHVANDADDFAHFFGAAVGDAGLDVLADRIFVGEVAAR